LLAVLLTAAALLWYLEGRTEESEAPQPSAAPALMVQSDMRTKRETAYDKDVAALQALLESGAADQPTQEIAAGKLTEIIAWHQHEIALETALSQAGFEAAVVIAQNNAVTVMIPPEELNEATSSQILTLCIAHTDAGAENVRIMALPNLET